MRVAVIGAGASGIASTKVCLDHGFDPVCLESSDAVGGLWRFTEVEAHSSVYRSTIINTSRQMTNFSDFPIPGDFPTFMHHTKITEYFNSYVDHFKFRNRIRFHRRVIRIQPAAGGAVVKDGLRFPKWSVTWLTTEAAAPYKPVPGTESTEVFDAIMICTGHHWLPRMVDKPGRSTFKGTQTHSHAYKDPKPFEKRNVCVVGIGNSGVDVAVETCRHAKQVYLSTRSGAWILPRLTSYGQPLDHVPNSRCFQSMPMWLQTLMFEGGYKFSMGDLERFGLKPKFNFFAAHPTINGELCGKIMTHEVIVKKDIKEIKSDSVLFEGDSAPTPVDDIIWCTGYRMDFPFLSDELSRFIKPEDNELFLYDYVFPPDPALSNVAFIGYIQPLGAIMPISEMQARWFCGIHQKRLATAGQVVPLPSEPQMLKEIEKRRNMLLQRYKRSPRHTIQVDYVTYMDELAGKVGCRVPMVKYFFTDRRLFYKCFYGPVTPCQYRLAGPGASKDAPQMIKDIYYQCYPEEVEYELKHGERVMPEFKTIMVLLLLLTSLLLYFTGTLSALSTRLLSR